MKLPCVIFCCLMLPTIARAQAAFVWADSPTAETYSPSTAYSYNSSGGANTIRRTGSGAYTIRFSGVGGKGAAGGSVQVTAYGGGNEYCKVVNWDSGGTDFIVNARCFAPSGTPADAQYCVTIFWPAQKPFVRPRLENPAEPGKRTINARGHVEIRNADGSVTEFLIPCGYTTTFPNGTSHTALCSTQARAAIPPSTPDDVESAWLQDHAKGLLGIIGELVGNDAQRIENYVNSEGAESTWYQKIILREETISLLVQP